MEITKKIKTTPKNIEMLFNIGGEINLRFYDVTDFYNNQFNDYQFENEKFNFKCTFRVPDEIADEVKKARSFNGVWKLYEKYNAEAIVNYTNEQIKKYQKEITQLEQIKNAVKEKTIIKNEKTDELANNISIDNLEITHKTLPDLYDEFVDEVNENMLNNDIDNNDLYSDENFKEWVKDNLASNNLTINELANSIAKEFQRSKENNIKNSVNENNNNNIKLK